MSSNSKIQITELKESFTDYLTGLSNRRGLYDFYDSLNKDSNLHAIFLDVDNFKRVNDLYGHSVGDDLLLKISTMIKENTTGFCCRMGGDEFVVLIDGTIPHKSITQLAENYKNSLEHLDFRSDILSLCSLSIGIVFDQPVNQPLDQMLFKCDTAMYQAKYSGKNQYKVFSETDHAMMRQKTIEMEMDSALKNGQFKLYIQPKINIVTSKLQGIEAFSRWHHPVDGIRLPEIYLPIFEKNGFITRLTFFLFEEMCKTKQSWLGKVYEHIPFSINISRLNLYDTEFPSKLLEITKKYNVDPKEIDIEIKEACYIKDKEALSEMIQKLRDSGFKISMDDFGSEYATLNLIRELPVDNIKLSPKFLYDSLETERGKDILRNLIMLCLSLHQEIIAVGIESKNQLNFILNSGCQVAQGNIYSKALPVEQIEKIIKDYPVYFEEVYTFTFNNTLRCRETDFSAEYTGKKVTYGPGLFPDTSSLYLPGGKIMENCLKLPLSCLTNDSYTISCWIQPKELHQFTSLIFAQYKTGFMSLLPLAWEGNSSFRIHLDDRPMEWYDCPACHCKPNKWIMISASYNGKTGRMMIYLNDLPLNFRDNVPIQRVLNELYVGGDIYQNSFIGYIADLRIYNEVKDHSFIKDLFLSYRNKERITENIDR